MGFFSLPLAWSGWPTYAGARALLRGGARLRVGGGALGGAGGEGKKHRFEIRITLTPSFPLPKSLI